MWVYEQASGRMTLGGKLLVVGYSGAPGYVNQPEHQSLPMKGCLPQGTYEITAPYDNPKTGKYTLNLIPHPENVMFGRADFRIHGDNQFGNQSASEGCIILPRFAREAIWANASHTLVVVHG